MVLVGSNLVEDEDLRRTFLPLSTSRSKVFFVTKTSLFPAKMNPGESQTKGLAGTHNPLVLGSSPSGPILVFPGFLSHQGPRFFVAANYLPPLAAVPRGNTYAHRAEGDVWLTAATICSEKALTLAAASSGVLPSAAFLTTAEPTITPSATPCRD